MSVKELRTAKAWTQAQLAEFSGLSLRTIQRIEKGHAATAESAKCLAAVFQVDVSALNLVQEIDETQLSEEEKVELENIRKIRHFIVELAAFLIIVPLICFASYVHNGEIRNGLGLAVGWGFWSAYQAIELFDAKAFFGASWEKRQLDKRMGRDKK
ncbi:helix-turn-helix domain-containing protein [Undibacterium cyanobacteriorum]|uniref:Helix-turn-helix domain-containing protein n=1 Tax=Undibacterium cyanobacteriorum TaxID=3073561 RepID=A0ABY9RKV4_9BURK|nr:helix-turn-helix domain-containing protein [Undibacterium sp. 20NA77.5]WMW81827.1 helix-turn-helix domain-containing protein [Undibacterium sp. 20NA77.5]